MTSPEIEQKKEEIKFLLKRKEILTREFNPYNHSSRIEAAPLRKWVDEVEFEVHPAFNVMLQKMEQRQKEPQEAVAGEDDLQAFKDNTPLEGRELVSVSKLLTAIAIDAYGYDPAAKRGPIPTELQGISDKLGLGVSADTIRKYLQTGAKYLPKDWKADK